MFYVTAVLLLFLYILSRSKSHTEVCLKVPSYVDACYSESTNHPIDPVSAKVNCLQRLLWYYEAAQNTTARDQIYFSEVSQHRGDIKPRTGFRNRKEYRLLTDSERKRLHSAFNVLYDRGIIRRYANLHSESLAIVQNSIAYLAWHRVFLAYFEEELRLVDGSLVLPYWDSSLDHDSDNPVNSLLWSRDFLGNAHGDVTTGPFAGWLTTRGSLWREYGANEKGRLISKDVVHNILNRCHTEDIILQTGAEPSNMNWSLEYHSRGVYNWVGGDMANGHFSAFDPVFYLHHAYIDYIWELFRTHQREQCHIDPATDTATSADGAGRGQLQDQMLGFEGHRYADGLHNVWTELWYKYEETPKCPDCQSQFLYCDAISSRCVAHSRRTDYNPGKFTASPSFHTLGVYSESFEPKAELIPKRNSHLFAHAPVSDGRTRATAEHDARLRTEAIDRLLKQTQSVELSDNTFIGIPSVLTDNALTSSWKRNIMFLDTSSSGPRRKFLSLF